MADFWLQSPFNTEDVLSKTIILCFVWGFFCFVFLVFFVTTHPKFNTFQVMDCMSCYREGDFWAFLWYKSWTVYKLKYIDTFFCFLIWNSVFRKTAAESYHKNRWLEEILLDHSLVHLQAFLLDFSFVGYSGSNIFYKMYNELPK